MTESERFIAEQVKTLVQKYDRMELNAAVSLSSFSVEFFVTLNGKKMQCFEMIDEGVFSEKKFNEVSKNIANYLREQPDFKEDGINKYTVVLE